VTTTNAGTIIARQIDRRRGLVFEIETSADGSGSGLFVRLAHGAPVGTRIAVRTRALVGTCDVPGQHVGEVAGRWDERFQQYGTVLLTDDPAVDVARRATACALYVGTVGRSPDLAVFARRPFSRVRMR
jgi:hypothetical protein